MEHFFRKMGQDFHTIMTMLNSIQDLVFIMKKNKDSFQYIFANQSALNTLRKDQRIYGKYIEDVVPKRRAKRLLKYYEKAIIEKETIYFEETIEEDGVTRIGQTALNPLVMEDGSCEYVFAIVREVTERMKREKQLKETKRRLEKSKKRLESLIINNLDAVYEMDLKGNFVDFNQKVTELLGYEREELIGKPTFNIIVKEDREHVAHQFQDVLSGKKREYEMWILTKKGEKLLLEIKNIPIIVEGVLEGVVGIASDITEERALEIELEQTKDELQLVWENTSDGIFLMAHDGSVLSINPSFEKMFGFTIEDLEGNTHPPFLPTHLKGNLDSFFSAMNQGESILNEEVKRYTKNGKVLDVLASYRPVNKGKILAVVMYKDITERKKMIRKMEESEKRYRKIVEQSPEGIIIFREEKIEYANKVGLQFLGIQTLEDAVGKSILPFIQPENQESFLELLKEVVHNPDREVDSVQVQFKHGDGHIVDTEVTAAPIEHSGRPAVQAIFRDITMQKEYEEQLTFLAYHDPLTGLMNRRAFSEKMEEAIINAREKESMLAVMFMDMDKFKDINDNLGHDVGDELLKQFSNRLMKNVRANDVLCRVGGDEFLVLLTNIKDKNNVIEVADRLYYDLQQPYKIKEHRLHVTSSFGISLYPKDGKSAKRLIHLADMALYLAKDERNEYLFYSE